MFERISYWLRRRRLERELDEEIESHRAMRQAALERAGLQPARARDASRRAMGNVTLAQEDARRVWVWPWLESIGQDVRYVMRTSARSPGFAASVVVVTALGIGAVSCIFGLLDALVLRSLPVPEPERLVYFSRPSFSYPIFQQVQARGADVFAGVFAWNLERLNIQWNDEPEPADVLHVTGRFHPTLGVESAAGRLLSADDDRIGGGRDGRVAVISYGCWQRRFGGDATVIGRTVRIERLPFTIVGVTPPGFFGVAAGTAPELTIPLAALPNPETLAETTRAWLHLMGRLRPGLTLERANLMLRTFWPAVLEVTTRPGMPADRRAMYLERETSLESARAGFSRVRNRFERPLWLLFALVGLLLIVACASAANLTLARSSFRRREVAVRLALGASRSRVVRQLITEVCVLTALGAVGGFFLASWGRGALLGLMSTAEESIVLETAAGSRLLLFIGAIAAATAVASAVIPAFRATDLETGAMLKDASGIQGARLRRWSLNAALVVAQVAVALVLIAGAALFVRSLLRVLSQDAGFDRNKVLVVATDPVFAGYEGERLARYYAELLEGLSRIPGVTSASLSMYPPISNDMGSWTQSIGIDGAPVEMLREGRTVHFAAVSPGYFRTLGMPLLHGRDFTPADDGSAGRVVVVSESLARTFFGIADPLGRRITIGRNVSRRDLTIVGIVRDAKYQRLQEPTRRIAYLPQAQTADVAGERNLFVAVRVAGRLTDVTDAVRRQVRRMDSGVPIRLETIDDRIRESVVTERVMAALGAALGGSSLALACASLYGLLACAVSRRKREIGLRRALGAERTTVLLMVLRDSMVLTTCGVAIGLAAALALGRFARSLLFQIAPADPVSLGSAGVVMLAVALGAALLPAFRAASIDPIVALRSE